MMITHLYTANASRTTILGPKSEKKGNCAFFGRLSVEKMKKLRGHSLAVPDMGHKKLNDMRQHEKELEQQ